MEQQATDVPVSASGQFRSRITANASQRRLNREPLNEPTKPATANEKHIPSVTSRGYTSRITDSLVFFISWTRRRWLFQVVALACTMNFTYDMLTSQLSIQESEETSVSPLNSLSQPFRLSRLADLYEPTKFQSFVLSPLYDSEVALNVTACLCITSKQIQDVAKFVVDWPGFVSLVIVYSNGLSSNGKKALRRQLRALSKNGATRQKVYAHLFEHPQHIPPPFNSLINLARFYAPTELVLLVPSLPFVPVIAQQISSLEMNMQTLAKHIFVFMGNATTPDIGEFDGSSAILVNKATEAWCPQRFMSMQETQWKQCLWTMWLLSLGEAHLIPLLTPTDAVEARLYKGASTLLAQDHILERIDHMMIPKFRSETCVHVLRNLNALRQKEETPNGHNPNPVFAVQRLWLRGACAEAFEVWGDIFL